MAGVHGINLCPGQQHSKVAEKDKACLRSRQRGIKALGVQHMIGPVNNRNHRIRLTALCFVDRDRIRQRQRPRHAAKAVITILLANLDNQKSSLGINMGNHTGITVGHNRLLPTLCPEFIGLLQPVFA